jgi:hypothetical protein
LFGDPHAAFEVRAVIEVVLGLALGYFERTDEFCVRGDELEDGFVALLDVGPEVEGAVWY